MTRQFIACAFRANDTRTYTYAYDGDEPLSVGDIVLVAGRNGEGTKKVHVAEVGVAEPEFACKPILGRAEPEAPAELDLAEPGADETF